MIIPKGGLFMKSKKMLSIIILLSAMLNNCVSVSAQTANLNTDIDNATSDYLQLVDLNTSTSKIKPKLPAYGEREYSTVLKTQNVVKVVEPSGQPTEGYSFPKGGSVYVNTNGGLDISVSVSLTWGVATLGLSTGYIPSDNVGGLSVNIPAGNGFYKVKLAKKYKFSHVRVDCYQYNEFKYSYYKTTSELISISAFPERVK